MFELMHQPVQTRQTPYGDHPQRNGNSDHNRTAEDIGYLHLAVVGKGEREVWIEKQTGGERTGRGGHQWRKEFIPERHVVIAGKRLRENQRGRDRRAEERANGASRCQNRPVQGPDAG